MKNKKIILMSLILMMISSTMANQCISNNDYLNVNLVPHYFRDNQEINIISNLQNFDYLYFEIKGSSNTNVTNLTIVDTYPTLSFNNNLSNINNESRILAISYMLNSSDYNSPVYFSITLKGTLDNQSIFCSDSKTINFINQTNPVIPSINDPIGSLLNNIEQNILLYLIGIVIILIIFKYFKYL